MTVFAAIIAAASLAVTAHDRLAMADRLFNRGEAAAARAEYKALVGAKEIDAAELAYRLVASASAVGDKAAVRKDGAAFLKAYPASLHADKVRLLVALAGSDGERLSELKLLDRDGVPPAVRAEALYRLAEATGDAQLFERSFKTDPSGRFAPYAKIAHATKLLEKSDAAERRQGVAELMDLVYGKDEKIARDALYLAAVHSYREGRYGESSALLKRYGKLHPGDARAVDVARLAALSELMAGRYAAAIAASVDESDETFAYVKAVASFRMDMHDEAKRLSRKYLDDFPQGGNRAAIELQLARLEFDDAVKTNDGKVVLAAAKRCLSLSGAASDRMLVAWALEKNGEVEKAEDEYSAVARDFPKSALAADALYRRAMSLLRREKWSAAELSLAEALSSGKLDGQRAATAFYWRGLAAFRAGHGEEAAGFLRKAIEGGIAIDERREARLVIADIDIAAGRTNDAVKAYAELVREGALERMGAAKTLSVGRILSGEESKMCARALAGNASPEWRQFGYALLGDAENADGNFTAAADAYRKCLAEECVTEVVAPSALKLGLFLVRDGEPGEAESVLKRAVELNKANNAARAAAYLGLAKAALLRDDAETAKGYATVIATLFENTPSAAEAKEILKR